jgi:ATP-dependent DNA helicase RecG
MAQRQTQTFLDFDARPETIYSVDDIFNNASEELLKRLWEDKRFERKPCGYSGEPLGRYFSMWANTSPHGGLVVIGVANDGRFEGCRTMDNTTINKVENTGHVFCPDAHYKSKRVPCRNDDGHVDFLILFRIDYHPTVVVKTTKGGAYVRRSDECHKMTPDEVRELAIDKGQVPFEEEPCRLKYPDDFDLEAVRTWAVAVRQMMDSGHDLADTEVLENRHLGKFEANEFKPNNACALLFARDPCALFAGCKVRFIRFEGNREGTGEQYNAVKDIWVEGTIPSIIVRAADAIRSQVRTFRPMSKVGQKFDMVDEYPDLAWHEAIVNACVHRSYGNGMKNISVFVRMFDDHLEIESPGPFPPFVTAENVYKMHKPRNPRIMEALYFLKMVQMNREGTRRMRETMAALGLPAPEFEQKEIGYALVRVTLKNNIEQRKVWIDRDVSELISDAFAATLEEDEKRVLNWLAENKQIRINDVVRILEISWQRARRLLYKLAINRVLQYVRFKQSKKDVRDSKAFFRLASAESIPKNARIVEPAILASELERISVRR